MAVASLDGQGANTRALRERLLLRDDPSPIVV